MDRYAVKLTGETPLLHHADDIGWRDFLKAWLAEPDNKKASVAGDDRTPAFTWIGSLYQERGMAVIPADNLMTMLREGGAKCPTGRKQETYKRLTQSGMLVDQSAWVICADDKPISLDGLEALKTETDFQKHSEWARARGFELFVKSAKIQRSKHIRVRPRFDRWSCAGTLTVLDQQITADALKRILDAAGMYAGLGDWRPSSPQSPGLFGRFSVEIKPI